MIGNLVICFGATIACIVGYLFDTQSHGVYIVGGVVFACMGVGAIIQGRNEQKTTKEENE